MASTTQANEDHKPSTPRVRVYHALDLIFVVGKLLGRGKIPKISRDLLVVLSLDMHIQMVTDHYVIDGWRPASEKKLTRLPLPGEKLLRPGALKLYRELEKLSKELVDKYGGETSV